MYRIVMFKKNMSSYENYVVNNLLIEEIITVFYTRFIA